MTIRKTEPSWFKKVGSALEPKSTTNISGLGTISSGAITSSGNIETTSTDADSIKTAGGGIFAKDLEITQTSTGGGILLLNNTDTTLGTDQVIGRIDFKHADLADAGVGARIDGYGASVNGETGLRFYTGVPSALIKSLEITNTGQANFAGAVKVGAYTLPATDGTAGQVLVTNGSGVLTWTTL